MDNESNEWEERYSKKHDKKYWKNKTTGESSWKDPNKVSSKKKKSDDKSSSKSDDNKNKTDVVVDNVESNKEEVNNNDDINTKNSKEEIVNDENIWEEKFSKKHDKKYWKNKDTGETSWKDPNKGKDKNKKENKEKAKKSKTTQEIPIEQENQEDVPSKQEPAEVEVEEKDSEWEERYSKKHDRKYWKNKATGESSWKDPHRIAKANKSTDEAAKELEDKDKDKSEVKHVKRKTVTFVDDPSALAPAAASLPLVPVVEMESSQESFEKMEHQDDQISRYEEEMAAEAEAKAKAKAEAEKQKKREEQEEKKRQLEERRNEKELQLQLQREQKEKKEEEKKRQREIEQQKLMEEIEKKNDVVQEESSSSSSSSSSSISSSSSTKTEKKDNLVENPDNWEEKFSKKYKRSFWKNKITGKTTWKRPQGFQLFQNSNNTLAAGELPKEETFDSLEAIEKRVSARLSTPIFDDIDDEGKAEDAVSGGASPHDHVEGSDRENDGDALNQKHDDYTQENSTKNLFSKRRSTGLLNQRRTTAYEKSNDTEGGGEGEGGKDEGNISSTPESGSGSGRPAKPGRPSYNNRRPSMSSATFKSVIRDSLAADIDPFELKKDSDDEENPFDFTAMNNSNNNAYSYNKEGTVNPLSYIYGSTVLLQVFEGVSIPAAAIRASAVEWYLKIDFTHHLITFYEKASSGGYSVPAGCMSINDASIFCAPSEKRGEDAMGWGGNQHNPSAFQQMLRLDLTNCVLEEQIISVRFLFSSQDDLLRWLTTLHALRYGIDGTSSTNDQEVDSEETKIELLHILQWDAIKQVSQRRILSERVRQYALDENKLQSLEVSLCGMLTSARLVVLKSGCSGIPVGSAILGVNGMDATDSTSLHAVYGLLRCSTNVGTVTILAATLPRIEVVCKAKLCKDESIVSRVKSEGAWEDSKLAIADGVLKITGPGILLNYALCENLILVPHDAQEVRNTYQGKPKRGNSSPGSICGLTLIPLDANNGTNCGIIIYFSNPTILLSVSKYLIQSGCILGSMECDLQGLRVAGEDMMRSHAHNEVAGGLPAILRQHSSPTNKQRSVTPTALRHYGQTPRKNNFGSGDLMEQMMDPNHTPIHKGDSQDSAHFSHSGEGGIDNFTHGNNNDVNAVDVIAEAKNLENVLSKLELPDPIPNSDALYDILEDLERLNAINHETLLELVTAEAVETNVTVGHHQYQNTHNKHPQRRISFVDDSSKDRNAIAFDSHAGGASELRRVTLKKEINLVKGGYGDVLENDYDIPTTTSLSERHLTAASKLVFYLRENPKEFIRVVGKLNESLFTTIADLSVNRMFVMWSSNVSTLATLITELALRSKDIHAVHARRYDTLLHCFMEAIFHRYDIMTFFRHACDHVLEHKGSHGNIIALDDNTKNLCSRFVEPFFAHLEQKASNALVPAAFRAVCEGLSHPSIKDPTLSPAIMIVKYGVPRIAQHLMSRERKSEGGNGNDTPQSQSMHAASPTASSTNRAVKSSISVAITAAREDKIKQAQNNTYFSPNDSAASILEKVRSKATAITQRAGVITHVTELLKLCLQPVAQFARNNKLSLSDAAAIARSRWLVYRFLDSCAAGAHVSHSSGMYRHLQATIVASASSDGLHSHSPTHMNHLNSPSPGADDQDDALQMLKYKLLPDGFLSSVRKQAKASILGKPQALLLRVCLRESDVGLLFRAAIHYCKHSSSEDSEEIAKVLSATSEIDEIVNMTKTKTLRDEIAVILDMSHVKTGFGFDNNRDVSEVSSVFWIVSAAQTALRNIYAHGHSNGTPSANVTALKAFSTEIETHLAQISANILDYKRLLGFSELLHSYQEQLRFLVSAAETDKRGNGPSPYHDVTLSGLFLDEANAEVRSGLCVLKQRGVGKSAFTTSNNSNNTTTSGDISNIGSGLRGRSFLGAAFQPIKPFSETNDTNDSKEFELEGGWQLEHVCGIYGDILQVLLKFKAYRPIIKKMRSRLDGMLSSDNQTTSVGLLGSGLPTPPPNPLSLMLKSVFRLDSLGTTNQNSTTNITSSSKKK